MKQPGDVRSTFGQKVLVSVLTLCLLTQSSPIARVAYAAEGDGAEVAVETADPSAEQDTADDETDALSVQGSESEGEAEQETVPADAPAAVTIGHRTVSAETGDATVEVEGELPSDATLTVTELGADTATLLTWQSSSARTRKPALMTMRWWRITTW